MNHKRIAVVDFDGVIAEYDGWKGIDVFGKPIEGAVETLTKLHDMNWDIIVFTCRGTSEALRKYLDDIGLFFVKINDTSHNPDDANKLKPVADVHIDDRDWRALGKPFDRRVWKRVLYTIQKHFKDE